MLLDHGAALLRAQAINFGSARIEDAETFEHATGFLSAREKFAALNSPAALAMLFALPETV